MRSLLLLTLLLLIGVMKDATAQSGISFTSSFLAGENLQAPTCLQFGPDNRLYTTDQFGRVIIYTVRKNGPNNYEVTNTEELYIINQVPNHDDRGGVVPVGNRQVTGLLVTGTAASPIIYATSSDPRIGGGGELGDVDLDTNSGMLHKLTKSGSTWNITHVVRGLPRAEENHAPNGILIDPATGLMYLAQGGNTNAGSPSNNFAYLTEFALSGAILTIDLNMIDSQFGGSYTLPTLDDPTRANNADGTDIGDPWGGNDGLNQSKVVIGGPIQIYSTGYRNVYDLVLTKTPGKSGRMYTIDNGANGAWGGVPEFEGTPNVTNRRLAGEPGSTSPTATDGAVNNMDNLHLVTQGYYAGQPNPIRANPAGAGLYWFDNATNISHFELQPTVDWPPYPVSMADPQQSDFRNPGVNDGALWVHPASTNGMAEYTASNFNGAMKGDILAASFGNSLVRLQFSADGTSVTNATDLFSNFGELPLDVVAQGDNDVYPGTVWVLNYQSNTIAIFEPVDQPVNCSGDINSMTLDDDQDGYSNGDETQNLTDPCNAASKPSDFDGDHLSNLIDPDDDNDNLSDIADKFAWDATNGTTTVLPLDYPFLNGVPGTGFFGVGVNGLMTNNVTNYDAQYDPADPLLIVGGAVGAFSVPAQTGDATINTQKYAFQFGVPIAATVGTFTMQGRLLGSPFFNGATGANLGTQSQGIYFGTGDQDNYLKFVLHANNGNPGFQILAEQNGVVVNQQMIPVSGILSGSQIDLFIDVNVVTGAVQCRYQTGAAAVSVGQAFTVSGGLLTLLQAHTNAVAIGIIASAGNKSIFSASWDFMRITTTPVQSTNLTNVVRINAGGTAQTFGAEAWVADQYFTGGSTYSTAAAIANTTSDQIYQTERFGNFTYHIPVTGAGTYAVDLHLAEIYHTTAGSRVFNISVENGQFVRNNLDLISAIGPLNTAGVIRADNINVTDGFIDITFTTVADNAKISGIAVSKYPTSTANVAPFIAQAYGNKTVPSTQTTLVIPMSTIFGDDGGVANLTFAMSGNTNAALVTSTSVAGGNLTLNLSGTAGSGTITLRATDAGAPVLSTTTTFLLTVTAPTTTTLTNVVRINAGGAAQTFGTEGWVADQYFTGGSTYSTAAAIANTTSDPIYQTERFGTFTYHIPVTGAGTYAVDLHLAEIYQTTAGTRVFNVNVENGQFIRNNLDLISAIGPINTAGVIRADNLNITDGFIDITFTTVVDNAKVSGIAVSKYSTTNAAPFIAQPYANQTVPSTQATLVIPMSTIFGDDGGVANLTFAVAGNTNAALVTSSSVASGNLTLNLSGTTGTGTVTLRATDAATPALSTTTTFTLTVNASTTNAAPFIAQAYGNQTVPSTQTTLVVPMSTIFGDDGGVANLTFALAGNTNAALVTSSTVAAGNLTLNLSGITGSGTITLRATDAATPALSTTTTFVLLVNSPVVTLTTLLRINSGGSAQTFGTEVWLADQYFTGGFVNGTSAAIANTTSDAVYQNERFGNFTYHIPVPSSGSYAVDLHLAEIYWIEPGKRSFNISVENGQFVRNNLDLITTYGSINTAAILRADNINVTDGFIDITFTNVLDNAKVSGITISRYSASGTSGRIAMEDNAPAIVAPPYTILGIGKSWNHQVVASDPRGQKLTFTSQNLPASLYLNEKSGKISGTIESNSGVWPVILRVTNESGLYSEARFLLSITDQVYQAGELGFVLFPNPAERTFSIKLDSKDKEIWNFVLTDVIGKPIDLGSREFAAGAHVVDFDLSSKNLSSGMYFMSVRTMRGKKTIKLALK